MAIVHRFGLLDSLWNESVNSSIIANTNTIFNMGCSIMLFPMLTIYEKLSRKIVKDDPEAEDRYKAELDGLDNRVKVAMGSRSTGVCGRFSVSWKAQNTSGLDRDRIRADYPGIDFAKYATQSRVFRVTEKKQKSA